MSQKALVGLLVSVLLAQDILAFTSETSSGSKRTSISVVRRSLLPPGMENADLAVISTSSSATTSWLSETTALNIVSPEGDETGLLLSNQAIIATFVIGLVPFAVATVEFWRRIAVGDSFGTGKDSVVIIGEDDAPLSSRGRRVLGKGALVTAYILFGLAAAVLAIVLYAVISSGTTAPSQEILSNIASPS